VTSKINRDAHEARLVARVQECYSTHLHPSIHPSTSNSACQNYSNHYCSNHILASCISKIYYCISKSHYACWDYTLRIKITIRNNNNLVCISKPHSWVLKSHYECLNHTQSVEATTLSVTKSHLCMCTFFMGFSGFFVVVFFESFFNFFYGFCWFFESFLRSFTEN
jgi:hypothetical protein